MRIGRTSIAVTLVALFLSSVTDAQNLIPNSSFEAGILPTQYAQFDRVSSWSSASFHNPNGDCWAHSPDYYDDQTPFSLPGNPSTGSNQGVSPIGVMARTGNRFIGLDDYELAHVEVDWNAYDHNRFYTLELYVRPSSYNFQGTSELRIYGSRQPFGYESSECPNPVTGSCTTDYTAYHFGQSPKQQLASIPINLNDYPIDQWSRVAVTFYVPGTQTWFPGVDIRKDYKYITLDMNPLNVEPWSCGGHFIFIDDVSLSRAEFCNTACAPILDTPYHGTVQNIMVADAFCPGAPYCAECVNRYPYNCGIENDWQCMPQYFDANCCCGVKFFEMIIGNAVGVNFWVRSRWGANDIVYERHEFDANGLKFSDLATQDYFVLQWMGRNKDGQHLPSGQYYDYELEYWNCDNSYSYESGLYYEIGNEWYNQPNEVINGIFPDCCPNNLTYQNITFSGNEVFKASSSIIAGYNVGAGTSGPVIVSIGSNVLMRGGSAVVLEPGFAVLKGGDFIGEIGGCGYSDLKSSMARREYKLSSEKPMRRLAKDTPSIYPNPTSGSYTVRMPENDVDGEIRLTNVAGQVIRVIAIHDRYYHDDITDLPVGLYFIELTGSGFREKFKLIRQ